MASKPETGPDTEDREAPGSTQTNPAGASSEDPAEGGERADSRQSGSPQG